MSTPIVVTVEWLDTDAKEAVVTVSDGKHSLRCFAHPFHGARGAAVACPLATLGAEHVTRVTGRSENVRPVGTAFRCEVAGVVAATSPPTVKVGDLLVELDVPLPGDVGIGDTVEFVAARIDYQG